MKLVASCRLTDIGITLSANSFFSISGFEEIALSAVFKRSNIAGGVLGGAARPKYVEMVTSG